jgi:two-component system response regulator YesN
MFRLLIADDEYIEREALKSIIQRKFADTYEIKEAVNGVQAVSEAKSFSPHLIFMDIKMPGFSGIEAVKQIQEFLPDVHIVFITAYDYFDYAKEAIALHAYELLLKPVEVSTILELTQKITDKLITLEEKQHYNKEMESKLEQITKRFEYEFVETLNNYNASLDSILNYLKIMDIDFINAIFAYINFIQMNQDKSIGYIQKDFIRARFIHKVKSESEQIGIKCIVGSIDDNTRFIFIQSLNQLQPPLSSEKFLITIHNLLNAIKIRMNLDMDYVTSEVIQEPADLPLSLYHLTQSTFTSQTTDMVIYPYNLEEKLVTALEKLNFDDSRILICEIAKVLRKAYYDHTFNREVLGLYAIIKRQLKKIADDAIMPHADELADNISNDSEMISFFHRLFSYTETSLEKKVDKNRLLIQKICDYLEEHYMEDISLEQASDHIGFSSFYFSKLMKEYLNMSYVDYLTSIRIRKAKELLDKTHKTVSEIAFEVGYTDANYFTRVFKRIEGVTPSNYKAKIYRNL